MKLGITGGKKLIAPTTRICPMTFEIVSPSTGKVYKTVPYITEDQAEHILVSAQRAFGLWKSTSLNERIAIVTRFVDAFVSAKDDIAQELAHLIGRYELCFNYQYVHQTHNWSQTRQV